jgi:TMEM175 potassium channel family protein
MTTNRLETFSDGVFAIAATLLIIEVDVEPVNGSLGDSLLESWPSYLAYAISFLTIGIIWVNHHTVFSQIDRVDRTFLFINVWFLMLVAFIPFPTKLIADHLGEAGGRDAALTYGIVLTATAVSYSILWFYAAVGRRLIRPDAHNATVMGISRSYLPGPFLYGGSTAVAFVSPAASVGLFGAIALFYVLESSLFGRGKRATRAERDVSE